MNEPRDPTLRRIQARPGRCSYGMGVGVVLLDDVNPGFPGDLRNASGFPFPIQYELAEGIDIDALTFSENRASCLKPIRAAAQRLERMGARAIVGECGYFGLFQKEIAASVSVPVFMSPLLQVAWAQQLISPSKTVAILAATQDYLTEAHLKAVGTEPGSNYFVRGLRESNACPAFIELYRNPQPNERSADFDTIQGELVGLAREVCGAVPNVGAIVLECTGLPPYARAVQRAVELPVFSAGTLIEYAYSVAAHREYYGHV